jgi:hypothetical protein
MSETAHYYGIYIDSNSPEHVMSGPAEAAARDGGSVCIRMPCMFVVRWTCFPFVPKCDVPCPCGDPRHFIIKVHKSDIETKPNG